MVITMLDDTITAIATPIGEGGIGVIRISGKRALNVAGEMFRTSSGVPVPGLPTHTAHYGHAIDPLSDEQIDDGVLTVFRAPRSYTGEDSVEISCHGGIVPMRRVLEAAMRAGARLAEPGEFTKRAFLSGRIDLAQAEAVLDIIRARTDESLRVARMQFEGVLSTRIRMLREDLVEIMAHIEASIDFPDDVEEMESSRMTESIRKALMGMAALLETSNRGKIYREGISAVITGRPNVGKSSLLNALLRESRAIVTPIPGTTRDVIEESLSIKGIPVRTIDTAGVRETEDVVERMGVDRAQKAVEEADVVIAVLDAEQGFDDDAKDFLSGLLEKKLVVVLNKTDLIREDSIPELLAQVRGWLLDRCAEEPGVITTSASENRGIEALEDAIAGIVLMGSAPKAEGAMISSLRHRQAIDEAHTSLAQALLTSQFGMPLDLLTVDLRAAVDALGRITGETVSEDVIDRIFSEFCIGK